MWGHQIPYYYGKDKKEFVVAENKQMALKAILNSGNKNLKIEELKQDDDVLDMVFIMDLAYSIFNGILEPNNEILNLLSYNDWRSLYSIFGWQE